ncbi:hypothetical protein CPB84DRAFT_621728 [Gymnopilus junonius]|uniref:Uncharacterized protein n=1 Tax=Gymnopilus junonius TaxID=109634 RepID=A0A9P5N7Y1_GYMJU|nr:hypothetical protein CPB84DRAFT_621728 [Gymnopilus junonius]
MVDWLWVFRPPASFLLPSLYTAVHGPLDVGFGACHVHSTLQVCCWKLVSQEGGRYRFMSGVIPRFTFNDNRPCKSQGFHFHLFVSFYVYLPRLCFNCYGDWPYFDPICLLASFLFQGYRYSRPTFLPRIARIYTHRKPRLLVSPECIRPQACYWSTKRSGFIPPGTFVIIIRVFLI